MRAINVRVNIRIEEKGPTATTMEDGKDLKTKDTRKTEIPHKYDEWIKYILKGRKKNGSPIATKYNIAKNIQGNKNDQEKQRK
jgi:hypothetical protein